MPIRMKFGQVEVVCDTAAEARELLDGGLGFTKSFACADPRGQIRATR